MNAPAAFRPAYLALLDSGELERRVESAYRHLADVTGHGLANKCQLAGFGSQERKFRLECPTVSSCGIESLDCIS